MRVLFISKELGASELAVALKNEGCDIKLFVQDEKVACGLDGIVPKTPNWEGELSWVGKEGLIIFDDTGYGKIQSDLREQGYRVVGGSEESDRIEIDRLVGKQILEASGMNVLPTFSFTNLSEAVQFLKSHNDVRWVVKVNGGHISSLCYVGENYDQSDLIGILHHYEKQGVKLVNLQQRVTGIEIGVARYFNGQDWVGPIEMNVEHKSLMPSDIGPKTAEMGTLMWYDEDEGNKLFQETLAKTRSYLKDIDFRGDVDINCIINEGGVWPLEFTARFGNPATALQIELHESPWYEFLGAIADGNNYDLKFKNGYGVTVTVAVPPYPYYVDVDSAETSQGLPIGFSTPVVLDEWKHYGLEEVAKTKDGQLIVSSNRGCVAHISGYGDTIEVAQQEAYRRVKNLVVPKAFYRLDIGTNFLKTDLTTLKQWGWL